MYSFISFAIAVHDSMRYFRVVVKGNMVEPLVLIGVDCGRGFVVPGGVVGSMTVLLMAFAAEYLNVEHLAKARLFGSV
jgi:hypothetical protein